MNQRVDGLQRSLTVQRLVHNWVRPHWGLEQGTTPLFGDGVLPSTREDGGIAHLERLSLYHVLTDQCQLAHQLQVSRPFVPSAP